MKLGEWKDTQFSRTNGSIVGDGVTCGEVRDIGEQWVASRFRGGGDGHTVGS